jgi:outer membrane biosynthesis protein TonB
MEVRRMFGKLKKGQKEPESQPQSQPQPRVQEQPQQPQQEEPQQEEPQQEEPQQEQQSSPAQLNDAQKKEFHRLFNIYRNWSENLPAFPEDDLKHMLFELLQEIVASETADLEERVSVIEAKLGIVNEDEGEEEEGEEGEGE